MGGDGDTEKSSQCEGESKAVRMFNWNENRILLTGRQGQPEEAGITELQL